MRQILDSLANNGFAVADYAVFIVYILILVGCGVFIPKWMAKKKGANGAENSKDYFLAGNSLTWWAVGASLIAANISAEQFIGMSGSAYASGIAIAAYELMAAATLLVVAKFLLPVMIRKNIFTIIFSLLFLAGVMVFSFSTGTLFANMSAVADAMSAKIFSIYPPARLFVSALGGNWTAFLLFAAIAVALLGLLCFAAVKGFTFFYVAINATAEAKAFRMGQQKQTGKLLTLCKKELKQKLNTPIWIMNTDMGTLMAILLSILLVVTGREPIMEVLEAMSPLDKAPGVLFGLVIAAVQCMSLSATASVSMEGKGLWLIKSLPIRANTWLRSKLLVSMLPPVLGGFVCSLLLTIAWRLPVWNVPVMLGLSVLFAWAFSVVELALGLKFARFDWENPAEVVKQSAGVLLGMLVTFLVVGAGIALVLFLGPLGAAAMCVLLLVIALPIRLVMGKRSEKMLTNL